jgi:hypothetical protein
MFPRKSYFKITRFIHTELNIARLILESEGFRPWCTCKTLIITGLVDNRPKF